jgi:hypothetical protein
MACDPRTRPGATLVGAPPIPRLLKNFRPRSIVVWVASWLACSDALAIATGSPGAPELMLGQRRVPLPVAGLGCGGCRLGDQNQKHAQ